MNVRRQQLADAQSRLVQSQTMPPPSTRQFTSWDSCQEPPSTPMAPPRARDDNLHGSDYYYRGSSADPGYTDPIRMPMYGSDLYSNTRGAAVVVVSTRKFPTIVAKGTANLKASTTPCSIARHLQYH